MTIRPAKNVRTAHFADNELLTQTDISLRMFGSSDPSKVRAVFKKANIKPALMRGNGKGAIILFSGAQCRQAFADFDTPNPKARNFTKVAPVANEDTLLSVLNEIRALQQQMLDALTRPQAAA
jgi:hypothetical protein